MPSKKLFGPMVRHMSLSKTLPSPITDTVIGALLYKLDQEAFISYCQSNSKRSTISTCSLLVGRTSGIEEEHITIKCTFYME